MDPDVVLARMLKNAVAILDDSGVNPNTFKALVSSINELAEGVIALDTWIRGGGFPPKAWQLSVLDLLKDIPKSED